MYPLEAAILISLLALASNWIVQRQLAKLDDPGYLRRHGVVVVSRGALDTHAEAIGRYQDCDIWASVTFLGMLYRFDRIVQPSERERIGARELYLAPGLVYVTS